MLLPHWQKIGWAAHRLQEVQVSPRYRWVRLDRSMAETAVHGQRHAQSLHLREGSPFLQVAADEQPEWWTVNSPPQFS